MPCKLLLVAKRNQNLADSSAVISCAAALQLCTLRPRDFPDCQSSTEREVRRSEDRMWMSVNRGSFLHSYASLYSLAYVGVVLLSVALASGEYHVLYACTFV